MIEDGDEATTEATTAAEAAPESEAKTEGESSKEASASKKDGSKSLAFTQAELQKKYEKIKNNKGGMKGKSGKIMQIVVEAIKEINPVRMIQEFDPDPILAVNGIDVEKLKIPVNYLSDSFFDKFAARTKKSKQQLSKDFGVNVETKKEGEWISLGLMLKVGKMSNLKLGDYLNCLGLDMTPYEKKYDDYLLEV